MKTNLKKGIGVCILSFAFLLAAAGSGESTNSGGTKVGEVGDSKSQSDSKDKSDSAKENNDSADENDSNSEETVLKEEYFVGDVLQNGGLKMVYKSSGVYYTDNEFMQPEEGKKYIFLEFYCENTGDSDLSVSSFSFECYADGYACDAMYSGDNTLSATLSAGRSTTGKVYFTVPENAEEIQIEYETNYFKNGKVKFIYEGEKDSGFVAEKNTSGSEKTFNVGDIVQGDGLVISYLSKGEYTSDNMYITPKEGYHYIYCEFECENTSKSDQSVTVYDFDCYADGVSCDAFYGMDNSLSGSISPSRKVKGTVAFEVPIDAATIEVEYLNNYWTSDRIIFTY